MICRHTSRIPIRDAAAPQSADTKKIATFPKTRLKSQALPIIVKARSLKTLKAEAGVVSVKATNPNIYTSGLLLDLERAVPVRIGARLLPCFQPLQVLFCARVKTAQKSNQ